jgi:predicted nucleotidyltransferase
MADASLEDRVKRELMGNPDVGQDIERVLLFGSVARGTEAPDSDIDIVVVLRRRGSFSSYGEMLHNRIRLARALWNLGAERPVDLLVYTHDGWEALCRAGGSFVRQVADEARELV